MYDIMYNLFIIIPYIYFLYFCKYKNTNMKRLIYCLKCPFTKEIHYVGKSSSGMIRPLSHLNKSHSDKINEWVCLDIFIPTSYNIIRIFEVDVLAHSI